MKKKDKDKKFKLLLVDDEVEFLESLAERLRFRGLEPKTVYSGEDALSEVEKEEPDVVLLDIKMPGIDGIEVLKKVKEKYPNMQVVILTGHGTEKIKETVKDLGAFEYMKKPVDIDKLVPTLRGAFKYKLKMLENSFMAATFAEGGDFDTARKIMEDEDA